MSAMFNRQRTEGCDPPAPEKGKHCSPQAFKLVKQQCEGREWRQLHRLAKDTCPGNPFTELRVHFRCRNATSTTTDDFEMQAWNGETGKQDFQWGSGDATETGLID